MSAAPQRLSSVADALAFLRARATGRLRADSRQVAPGDGFIAWPGAVHDARAFVADALARGAGACIVEARGAQAFDLPGPVAAIEGLQDASGEIASAWLGVPSARLAVLAVTGTNGKTSSAWWLAHALCALSKQELVAHAGCGLVGTLGLGVPPALQATGMTTPDPLCLQQAFADFAAAGLGACAIEASSIGLAQARLAGTVVHTALFTNFTQDHLDWHADMADYWRAKRALFDWPGLAAAVVNVDDAQGARLHQELEGRPGLDLWSVSLRGAARLMAQEIAHDGPGLAFTVVEGGGASARLRTRLIGLFNVSNLLGVIAGLRTLGVSLADAVRVCAALDPVPGRMQQIARAGQPLVAVDYAHTPDALVQALAALGPLAAERGGQLWCVFGCGGERDAKKRPLMGAAAQRGADRVLVTSDNPRGEDPRAIVHQILQGTIASTRVQAEPDRAQAIAQAIAQAGAADVVLIAGKGHEDYQEVAGRRLPFDDMAHAQAALALRGGRA